MKKRLFSRKYLSLILLFSNDVYTTFKFSGNKLSIALDRKNFFVNKTAPNPSAKACAFWPGLNIQILAGGVPNLYGQI